jgi:hypothetical protein
MAQVAKRKLSNSTDGRGVKVAATATPGTLLHTAVTGTVAGTWDEVWIYAYNSDTTDRLLTIELGGTTAPDDHIKVTIPAQQGRFLVVDGAILQNGTVVRAFAATANVIVVTGFVNAITA